LYCSYGIVSQISQDQVKEKEFIGVHIDDDLLKGLIDNQKYLLYLLEVVNYVWFQKYVH